MVTSSLDIIYMTKRDPDAGPDGYRPALEIEITEESRAEVGLGLTAETLHAALAAIHAWEDSTESGHRLLRTLVALMRADDEKNKA